MGRAALEMTTGTKTVSAEAGGPWECSCGLESRSSECSSERSSDLSGDTPPDTPGTSCSTSSARRAPSTRTTKSTTTTSRLLMPLRIVAESNNFLRFELIKLQKRLALKKFVNMLEELCLNYCTLSNVIFVKFS